MFLFFFWQDVLTIYRLVILAAVRLAAGATSFIHKLGKGIPPWVPVKGQEKKSYQQLQKEAIESKRRDLAVLEANGGVWPGVRVPSHALFLWASGSDLTPTLEADHMPNKYIPKDLRYYPSVTWFYLLFNVFLNRCIHSQGQRI